MTIHDKLKEVEARFIELEGLLADPVVISNQEQYQKLAKEYSDITPLNTAYLSLKNVQKQAVNNYDKFIKLMNTNEMLQSDKKNGSNLFYI